MAATKKGPNDAIRVVWALGTPLRAHAAVGTAVAAAAGLQKKAQMMPDASFGPSISFSIPASGLLFNLIFTTFACEQALISFICIM